MLEETLKTILRVKHNFYINKIKNKASRIDYPFLVSYINICFTIINIRIN